MPEIAKSKTRFASHEVVALGVCLLWGEAEPVGTKTFVVNSSAMPERRNLSIAAPFCATALLDQADTLLELAVGDERDPRSKSGAPK